MSRRSAVTGMGAITPIGLSVDEFWKSVKAGRIGFDRITRFDTTDFKCKLAAEVKDFDGKNYMDPKAARRMELFSQYAVAATKEAIEDAALDMEKEDPYRVGVAVGSGTGSLQAMERSHARLMEKGPSRIEPLFVPLTISNMAAGNVSIQFGLKGKSINVVTACATGTNSIGEAFRTIQYGDAEVMVAGGTEGSICPIGIGGFSALTALSVCEDPERCSIPFDKERSGFVMGEGAAVVILEELEHARARGATSPLRRRTARARPRLWNMRSRMRELPKRTSPISMRTARQRIITICLRQGLSSCCSANMPGTSGSIRQSL